MEYHQRKSPRASWAHYDEGRYFVTVCTHEKEMTLGVIVDEVMNLSPIGSFLKKTIDVTPTHHSNCEIPYYVIMPNHFHAIIRLSGDKLTDGHRNSSLAQVVGSIKAAVSRFANISKLPFKWQTRFHDHIIRNEDENGKIRDYILGNVANWRNDCFWI